MHDHDFRVETDGLSMSISLAAYSKVIIFLYSHL